MSEAGFVIKKLDSVNTDADSENGESDSELAECQDKSKMAVKER